MAKYLNELTGRVVTIRSIEALPDDNKKHLKEYQHSVTRPEVLKIRKNAKN